MRTDEQEKVDEAFAVLTDIAERLNPEDAERLAAALEFLIGNAAQKTITVVKHFSVSSGELVEQAFQEMERERNSTSRSSGQPSGWWPPWKR